MDRSADSADAVGETDKARAAPRVGPADAVVADRQQQRAVAQVAGDVWFPNGMLVLGDDTLVVAESHADRLTAWTITDSGELVDRRVWADLGRGSAPDGICGDADGAIWYASVPGQRCTRVAEGGEVLDSVSADRGCFACMLGGQDGCTLYIVANRYGQSGASDGIVLLQRVAAPHAGRP
jgi:sugar lactone lactonase YvrE